MHNSFHWDWVFFVVITTQALRVIVQLYPQHLGTHLLITFYAQVVSERAQIPYKLLVSFPKSTYRTTCCCCASVLHFPMMLCCLSVAPKRLFHLKRAAGVERCLLHLAAVAAAGRQLDRLLLTLQIQQPLQHHLLPPCLHSRPCLRGVGRGCVCGWDMNDICARTFCVWS